MEITHKSIFLIIMVSIIVGGIAGKIMTIIFL